MALYSKADFEQAKEEGRLVIENGLDFGAFSLDLRVGKLFRKIRGRDGNHQMSTEEFLAKCAEEVSLEGDGAVLPPGALFYWQAMERIKTQGLQGEITSRSGWARLSTRSESIEDSFRQRGDYEGNPLSVILSRGAQVRVKKGDAVAQLFLQDDAYPFTIPGEINLLLDKRELIVERSGEPSADIVYDEIPLTMGPEIWIYEGGVLEPGKSWEQSFRKVSLESGKMYLPEGTFFISSSAEIVSIPPGYVGHVNESAYRGDSIFTTHANAPYVGPKTVFNGKITFENTMMNGGGNVGVGVEQSRLSLRRLKTPIIKGKKSSYDGQKGATLSRLS